MVKLEKEERENIIKDFNTGLYTKKELSIKYDCSYAQVLGCFRTEHRKQFYKEHKEDIQNYKKEHYQKNKKEIAAKHKQYAEEHKEQQKRYKQDYYQKHKEEILARPTNTEQVKKQRHDYYQRHKKEINQKNVEKLHNTPELRIAANLRNRIRKALVKTKTVKSKKTLELLGCSFQEARDYLQQQFKEGMTWENYGTVWHIDHIIPCASFDLTDEEEQKKCFNYKNLQPLFAEENLKKSDFLPDGSRGRDKKLNILGENNET